MISRLEELEDIREACQISAAISQIENNKRAPSVDLLVKLARALDCGMEDII